MKSGEALILPDGVYSENLSYFYLMDSFDNLVTHFFNNVLLLSKVTQLFGSLLR